MVKRKSKRRTKRSRLKKRTKRSSTKRSSTKRKTKQKGGDLHSIFRVGKALLENLEPIKVTYGTTVLQPNQDLTGKEILYNKKPMIKFNPHKEKTYLITMTDPDAPNGIQAKQIWTHYVVLMNNNSVLEEVYPYQPPTPPPNSGVHHYIFNAYEINKDTNVMGPNIANADAKTMDGSVYYKQILEPIIKNKDVMATFQFMIKSALPNH
jgi:phosphatidylethanolamine-binding protein (PEBP) family uncharacterized protein